MSSRLTASVHFDRGCAAGARFSATGDLTDLGRAVDELAEALDGSGRRGRDRRARAFRLAQALNVRGDVTGDRGDVARSIEILQDVLGDTTDGDPWWAWCAQEMALAHLVTYQQGHDEDALVEAITWCQRTMEAPKLDQDVIDLVGIHYAAALRHRYALSQDDGDLDAACRLLRSVLDHMETAAAGSSNWAWATNKLVWALRERFEAVGDGRDLEEAVALARALVQRPNQSPVTQRTSHRLLAVCLLAEYLDSFDDALLDTSIEQFEAAMAGRGQRTDAYYYQDLQGLLIAKSWRACRDRTWHELDDVVALLGSAVEDTAMPPPMRPAYDGVLADALGDRYEIGGDLNDLASALRLARRLNERAGRGAHPDPEEQRILGRTLQIAYDTTRLSTDLDEAIFNLEAAAVASRPWLATWPEIHLRLGVAFRERFALTTDPPDLDTARRHLREAFAHLHPKDPNRPEYQAMAERIEAQPTSG